MHGTPIASTAATAVCAAAGLAGLAYFWRRRRPAVDAVAHSRDDDDDVCWPCSAGDDDWISFCNAQRRRRAVAPSQSAFRVTAVVVFRVNGPDRARRYVVGHNDEACNLLNSCCAERAAFLQMAGLFAPRGLTVDAVYITTDAPHAVTPGPLCREYMFSSSWVDPAAMRIVLEGERGRPSRVESTLVALLPYASVYTRLRRAEQQGLGARLGPLVTRSRDALDEGPTKTAWRAAVAACSDDQRRELHPISFGAACVLADGSVATAWQKKALEYSCSLDAICQLAPAIEAARKRGVAPLVLCMADHFGVLHAPFAPARAYLCEHALGDVPVALHDEHGVLHVVNASELLPGLPDFQGCFE